MTTFGEIQVDGLTGLHRAFSRLDKDLAQDLRWELEEAANPTRARSETKNLTISGFRKTPFYSRMAIGVSRKETAVYVFPKWSGTKRPERKRPKLKDQMQPRLEAAADETYSDVEKRVEQFLDKLVNDFNRR